MEISWLKHTFLIIYALCSLAIFNSIYETSKSVVDELFHVDQGILYCSGIFQKWNPKITTLPGLYLLSLLTPRCTLYNLRMISFVCSLINFYLIFAIRSMVLDIKHDGGRMKALLDASTLITLPPLYFFSFLYYTDVPSLCAILFTIYFSLKGQFGVSSLFAFFSVLMRQTNIIWVAACIFASHVSDDMIKRNYPKMKLHDTKLLHFGHSIQSHLKNPRMMLSLMVNCMRMYYGYIFVILAFLAFLVKNGSIVVGDKSAHEASIHIPQLFYFSLFTSIFGFSQCFPLIPVFIKSLRRRNFIITLALAALFMAVVIWKNTIVHPYLLADNRHYTFYVWNRIYGRHVLMRYLMIPVYIFGMYVICKSLNGSIGFKLFYSVSTFLTFCLQGLIEVRYFLIPFIVLRLFRRDVVKKWTVLEFLINLIINYVTISNFHKIKIQWNDFDEPQRLIW